MIPRQSYSILVVPEANGSCSNWHFDKKALRAAFFVAAFLTCLLVFVLVHYFYLSWSLDSRSSLEQHNRELAQKLKSVQAKLGPIEKELRQAKSLSQKLQILTTSSGAENNDEPTLPQRDGKEVLSSLASLKNLEAQQIAGVLLTESTELLSQELRKQVLSMSQLVDHFLDRQELRSLLPSIHPVKGWLTSPFGTRTDPYSGEQVLHTGVDIAAREGTEIVTPAFGRVVFAGTDTYFGNLLVIDHGIGYQTQYGHLREFLVSVGDTVERGQPIAQVGNTGKSTGPHLHYEIRKFGIPVNPMQYMFD